MRLHSDAATVNRQLGRLLDTKQLAGHKEDGQHNDDGHGHANKGVQADEANDQVANEGGSSCNQSVGQLGLDMVDVVGTGSHGRHDGGVGDRGAVVTKQGAAQHGSDHQRLGQLKAVSHSDADGQQDGHGAPGGADGEGDHRADQAEQGGHQSGAQNAVHSTDDEVGGAQGAADAAHAPSNNDNHQDGGHLLDTADEDVEGLLEGHQLLLNDHSAANDGGQQVAGGQGDTDLGAGNILGGEAPADEHGEDHDKQNDQRQQHVPHGDLLLLADQDLAVIGQFGSRGAFQLGTQLGLGHGTKVHLTDSQDRDQHQSQNGVELIGNALQEGSSVGGLNAQVAELSGNDVHDVHAPAGDGDQDAHGGGGGVQNVGQLRTGDSQLVEHGAEDGAQNQAVAGVGEVDGQAAQPGSDLSTDRLGKLGGDGLCKGAGAAGFFHQSYEAADDGHQHDGLCIAAAGHINEQIVAESDLQSSPGVTQRYDQAAAEQSDEKGQNDVLGGKSQDDRQDGRDQGQ